MSPVTVHDLIAALPEPDVLAARCRAFAVPDAVFDSGYPTYSHTVEWAPKVAYAEMSNGGGDLYAIVFEPAGVFLYGFDHESDATPWREDDREEIRFADAAAEGCIEIFRALARRARDHGQGLYCTSVV